MSHVRSIDLGGAHQGTHLHHTLTRWLLSGRLSPQQNHSQSRRPASEEESALAAHLFHIIDQFYSSSFRMLSLVEKTRLSNSGSHSHLNQLSQYSCEGFIYNLTPSFFKGMVLIVLDQRVGYCLSCIDC